MGEKYKSREITIAAIYIFFKTRYDDVISHVTIPENAFLLAVRTGNEKLEIHQNGKNKKIKLLKGFFEMAIKLLASKNKVGSVYAWPKKKIGEEVLAYIFPWCLLVHILMKILSM